jgi:hypothetical protein
MRQRYLAAIVLLATVIIGCTSPPASQPLKPIRPATPAQALAVACPGTATAAARHSAALPHKLIPARFTPVAVVLCTPAVVFVNRNGRNVPETRRVATADLGRLMTALRARSARPRLNVICPAQRISVDWFVLVGSKGQVIRPAIPVTDCGDPSPAVLASLAALGWRKLP